MAPSEDSGCSWTSASLVMPLLYELQVLLSEGPTPSGVNVLFACALALYGLCYELDRVADPDNVSYASALVVPCWLLMTLVYVLGCGPG